MGINIVSRKIQTNKEGKKLVHKGMKNMVGACKTIRQALESSDMWYLKLCDK